MTSYECENSYHDECDGSYCEEDYEGESYTAQCRCSCHTEPKQKTYSCPMCGFQQTFDVAYMDSGRFCPSCDYKTDIPLRYWR